MRLKSFIPYLLLPFPSFLKVHLYRWLMGYSIGTGVHIGLSVVKTDSASIGDNSRIGHFNFIAHTKKFRMGKNAVIGHLNLLVGGDQIVMGDGSAIGRFNEINSILNPLNHGIAEPALFIGTNAIITAWHKIDFTDRVEIGDSAIIAGRQSCIWTHNRQQVKPVKVGRHCYVGSGVQFAPGSAVGEQCVVGLGAVITKNYGESLHLIAGVPAKPIRALTEEDMALVEFPTRPDLL